MVNELLDGRVALDLGVPRSPLPERLRAEPPGRGQVVQFLTRHPRGVLGAEILYVEFYRPDDPEDAQFLRPAGRGALPASWTSTR
jgi:hypothetical protein